MLLSLLAALFSTFGNHAIALDANALPGGREIVVGRASITSSANAMTLTQATQDLVVNWNSFNIGSNAALQFVQPSVSAVALNRVLSSDPSMIFGRLSANGKVFLVNPSGVLFGSTAKVDVGGLVASSLSISDADFLAGRASGKYDFSGNGGTVLNLGALTAADAGLIALLAPRVRNEGVISARLGSVALLGGQRITLDTAGDGLLKLAIQQGALDALVDNQGVIQAVGGLVYLAATGVGNLAATAVNNSGVIEAKSLMLESGTLTLLGASSAADGLVNSGILNTSSGLNLAPVGAENTALEPAVSVTLSNLLEAAPSLAVSNLQLLNVGLLRPSSRLTIEPSREIVSSLSSISSISAITTNSNISVLRPFRPSPAIRTIAAPYSELFTRSASDSRVSWSIPSIPVLQILPQRVPVGSHSPVFLTRNFY